MTLAPILFIGFFIVMFIGACVATVYDDGKRFGQSLGIGILWAFLTAVSWFVAKGIGP